MGLKRSYCRRFTMPNWILEAATDPEHKVPGRWKEDETNLEYDPKP